MMTTPEAPEMKTRSGAGGALPLREWDSSYSKERRSESMRTTRQMSITLPVEMAKLVKDKVASGAYAPESEVVREGLRALQERDAAVEKWLRDEVAPTYDRFVTREESTAPLEESRTRASRRHLLPMDGEKVPRKGG